jgi:hypothetical protein
VVKEVSQSEHEQISTRVITNYNHMHALTIQYYEVLQVYRLEVSLTKADRVIFIPMKLIDFNNEEMIHRFRTVLMRNALTPDIQTALQNYDVIEIAPDRETNFTGLDGSLKSFMAKPVVLTTTPQAGATATAQPANQPKAVPVSSVVSITQQVVTGLWQVEQTRRLANLLDRMIVRRNSAALYLPADVLIDEVMVSGEAALKPVFYRREGGRMANLTQPDSLALPLTEISRISISGSDPDSDIDAIVTLTLSKNGVRFPLELPTVRVAKGTRQETRVVQLKVGGINPNLKAHLNANCLYYSKAIFRSLDSMSIATLLSGFGLKIGERVVPISQLVEPTPIRYVGNYLAFKMNSDVKNDIEWKSWLEEKGIQVGHTQQDIVPLASGGKAFSLGTTRNIITLASICSHPLMFIMAGQKRSWHNDNSSYLTHTVQL